MMKKILQILIFLLVITAGRASFAESKIILAGGGFDLSEVFSIEFYRDDNYLYTTAIPFTRMDPTRDFVQSDGREIDSGKMDVGMLCKSNLGVAWFLKIHGTSSNSFFLSKIQYGFWRPWNMRYGGPSNGTIGEGWHPLPSGATRVYRAGTMDLNNMGTETWQQGTLCGFAFAIDPSRLDASLTYRSTIHFTLTLTP